MSPEFEAAQTRALPCPLVRTVEDAVSTHTRSGTPVADGYADLIEELRTLLDRVAAAAPPSELVEKATATIQELNTWLEQYAVDEPTQVSGQLITVPGRAQLLTPVLHVDRLDAEGMAGRVRFGRHYLGSNGAVHGGAIPLLFDDLLGRLALGDGRVPSRTAYLHVDYRSITPIDTDLQVECRFERTEGRKHFLGGVLRDGDRVCAEASGLFVTLRPGQP